MINQTSNNNSTVEMRDVTFPSAGETLRGHLFLPATYQEGDTLPIVLVTGSWTTVKEQMADLYASRLAEQGFAALTFDFRYYGESGGEPREYEVPDDKIADIRSALDFVETLPFVEQGRVGGLGVCFSTGLMAEASVEDKRLKSLALVAPWLHNTDILAAAYGSQAELQRRLDRGEAAKRAYETTGKVEYMVGASTTDQNAAMIVDEQNDYYINPQRGAIPEWPNRLAVMSWLPYAHFDGVAVGKNVRIPILVVHSEDAAIPDGAKRFYADVPTKDKEIYWTQGTQLDFYDQEPQVTKASSAAATHFRTTL